LQAFPSTLKSEHAPCPTGVLPERLEDYVAAENPVRFLDAFVGSLDLHALGFAKTHRRKVKWTWRA